MSERKPISNKLRFEVFKRDSFTCQYCGKKAPDVILEVDHINPVASGGDTTILNLVTSCYECNHGKGKRELSDDTVVTRQRSQLDELQAKREQIEMMVEWQRGLLNIDDYQTDELCKIIDTFTPGWKTTEIGKNKIRKLLKKYSFEEIVEAASFASEKYIKTDEVYMHASEDSIASFNHRLPMICSFRRLEKDDPTRAQIHYIRGILYNRFGNVVDNAAITDLIRRGINLGVSGEAIKRQAIDTASYSNFMQLLSHAVQSKVDMIISAKTKEVQDEH